VLRTRSRAEKKIARSCRKNGISAYLPLYPKTSRTPKGRRRSALLPLFPGYCFVVESPAGSTLPRLADIVQKIKVDDQEGFHRYLLSLHQALKTGLSVFPSTEPRVGALVEITGGPFLGFQGRVRRIQGRHRVTLLLPVIACGIEVEVDAEDIVPAESSLPS
jgi:transcription antitermination factor NusG